MAIVPSYNFGTRSKIKKIIVMGKARGRLIAVGLQSEPLEEIICNPLSK